MLKLIDSKDNQVRCSTLHHMAKYDNAQQHTAAHSKMLQHTAANCSTLQHTAEHCVCMIIWLLSLSSVLH